MMALPPDFYLGTSSWTAPSWAGAFYPPGLPPGEYLAYYARRFRTVEVDATWYAVPSARTVDGWRVKTPDGFLFAAKVPQVITHERVLQDCEFDLEAFLDVMRRLEEKLGVLLLQFPYFRKEAFPHATAFLERLEPFLARLPPDVRYAVEVRNRGWVAGPLLEVLRQHRVALALVDHPWMPTAAGYARIPGIVTADFLYVRWLGDRHGIEAITQRWDRLVVDRRRELAAWRDALQALTRGVERTHAYFNNHFAGCGYQSAMQFEEAWG